MSDIIWCVIIGGAMSHANIIIEIYCLLITVILLICNFLSTQKKTADAKSRIMCRMLTTNAGIIMAFTVTVIIDGAVKYKILNVVLTGICYALGAILTELFGEYIFCIVREKVTDSRKLLYALRAVCGAAMLMDIVSIFNGMYFGTVNGYHVRGPFYMVNQILILSIMLLELIYIFARTKIIGKEAAALAMYGILPLFSVILQIFVREYLLMYPAITLSLFIIYVVRYINQADMLNQKNEELTRAILENEKSRQEAEKANQAKSEFLSSMSHDIRTPLNAIIGMTGMAMDNIDNKKQALDNLGIVQASSRHLLSLVNDVLDLSMIERGKIQIAQNEFILPDLLTEIEKMSWPISKAKKQTFTVRADTVEDEFYIGDAQRIKQVLVNFISNAVKYTPSGGTITLKIDEEKTDDPDEVILRMACIDNGIGIEKERQQEIFKPFVREIMSTVNPVEGTGLGLTIVRNIVEAMHGKVELTSEKGKGSTFTALIPLKLAEEDKMLRQFENVRDKKVLFIADGEEFCDMIRENYPKIIGCPCDVVSSADVLADTWKKTQRYDAILVVSEEKVPEVIHRARAQYPETDILYGSSMQMLEDEEQILNAGADAVLYRPIFRTTLFEAYQTLRLKKKTVAGTDQYLTGKKVLVAEDQPINYEVVEYILKNAGAEVFRADNGKEAEEKFLASAPGYYDLILMDIMMPVMNGYDAAVGIRKADRPDADQIIIVAMTANAFTEDIQKAHECGMNAHISKPVEPDVIRETLLQLMGRQQEIR